MNNREIKFRVWDNRNKNWVGGPFEAKFFNNPEYSVSQFTGLKDSKGKEIYEGDILSVYHSHLDKYLWGKVFWINHYFQYFVKFYEGKEYFSTELKYIGNDWSLIGNIHQNPELLK